LTQQQALLEPVWRVAMKKYDIIRILGKGSYGLVVEAKDKQTKQKVAIKYIPDYNESEYSCVKTLREIKILKLLSEIPENTNTVKILDLFEAGKDGLKNHKEESGIFIVMEYMDANLKQLLIQY
jgi:mitogen-activated protein kinase 1/3